MSLHKSNLTYPLVDLFEVAVRFSFFFIGNDGDDDDNDNVCAFDGEDDEDADDDCDFVVLAVTADDGGSPLASTAVVAGSLLTHMSSYERLLLTMTL